MTRRYLIASSLIVALLLIAYKAIIPVIDTRLSWYEARDSYDWRNLLVTCEADTPMFNYTGFNLEGPINEPFLSSVEVSWACDTRDRSLESGEIFRVGLVGQNGALDGLVSGAKSCLFTRYLTETQSRDCRLAHFNAIDWLFENGVDINEGGSIWVLQDPIMSGDQEMFLFLLEKGADPFLRPPAADFYAKTSLEKPEVAFAKSHSAVEWLAIQIAQLDPEEFPDRAQSLQEMLDGANEWPPIAASR